MAEIYSYSPPSFEQAVPLDNLHAVGPSSREVPPNTLPEGVPSVETQIRNFETLRNSDTSKLTGEQKLWKGLEASGYGKIDEAGNFRFDAPFLRHRLESSKLTEDQKAEVVSIVSGTPLSTVEGKQLPGLNALHRQLADKIGEEGAAEAARWLLFNRGQTEFFSSFAAATPDNKGFGANGDAWIGFPDGSKITLESNGVLTMVAKDGKVTKVEPPPIEPPPTEPSSKSNGVNDSAVKIPDQENPSMPVPDGGYRSVATVTAPVYKASGEWPISSGTVMQAELVEKDGNYFLKAGEKLYAMNTHASGRKIDSEAAAVRLAQDYLRYGYITTPKAVVELSEPAGPDAQGNVLAISAVDKKTGTVNTAQLEQVGSDMYRLNGHEFRAASDAKAVELAIARLENSPVRRSPFAPQGVVA